MDEKHVVATLECSGLQAVVTWNTHDNYDVTVTGGDKSHTWHDIPYIGAALHQAVDAIQIFASMPRPN